MTPQERSDKLDKIYDVIAVKRNGKLHSIGTDGTVTTFEYFPVMIGECFDWMENAIWLPSYDSNKQVKELVTIMELWKSKRLPIDEQSDECVTYIHSLIK